MIDAIIKKSIEVKQSILLDSSLHKVIYNSIDVIIKYSKKYGNPNIIFLNIPNLIRFYGYNSKEKTIIDAVYNNENIKVTANEISEIIREHKTRSNKDLVVALEFVKKDFELTKESVIKMTEHLDKLEVAYNTILKEYKSRNGK